MLHFHDFLFKMYFRYYSGTTSKPNKLGMNSQASLQISFVGFDMMNNKMKNGIENDKSLSISGCATLLHLNMQPCITGANDSKLHITT